MKENVLVIGPRGMLAQEFTELLNKHFQVVHYPNTTLAEGLIPLLQPRLIILEGVTPCTVARNLSLQAAQLSERPLFEGPGILVDSQLGRVLVEGKRVHFSQIEMNLICLLMRNPNRVFSRDEIITQVWGLGVYVLDRVVDSHIRNIRKKLGPFKKHIETVYGEGYKFNSEIVSPVPEANGSLKAA